jgi:hypothetical protein
VLRAGVRDPGGRRVVLEVEHGVHVTGFHGLFGPGVELLAPDRAGAAGVAEPGLRQVVRGEPGTDDQHAVVAQRRELAPHLEQPTRIQRRHGHLQNGYVRLGEHLDERHICAVVEAAVGVLVDLLAGPGQQPSNVHRQLGSTRRVVGDLVVALREPAEVVGQRDLLGGTDGQRRGFPVRGDHQDRLGTWQVAAPGRQFGGPGRVVGQRRCAVR